VAQWPFGRGCYGHLAIVGSADSGGDRSPVFGRLGAAPSPTATAQAGALLPVGHQQPTRGLAGMDQLGLATAWRAEKGVVDFLRSGWPTRTTGSVHFGKAESIESLTPLCNMRISGAKLLLLLTLLGPP